MKQDWANDKLCDIVLIGDGNHSSNYPKKSEMVTEGIPFIRATNIINGKITKDDMRYITKEKHENLKKGHLLTGDILFSNRGQIGKMAIVNKSLNNSNLNSQLAWFRCLESINNKFLYYQLLSPIQFNKIMNQQSGTALQQVTIRQLKNIEVSYPSLTEQKRIVAKLDDCFAAIDKARANVEKNLNNAKELFQSQLNEIFSQKGDGWVEKKLREVFDVRDGTHDSPKYINEGIPFVTQKNITDGGLKFDKVKFINQDDHDKFYKRSNVAFNDIIISMIGANRGMACIVDDKRLFSIKNVGLIKSNEHMNQKYILYYLKSPLANEYVSNSSKGSAQRFIGLGKLRDFPIPFVPLEKQKEISFQIDQLKSQTQTLESNYQQELDALDELKKSILQKAFSGELTIDNG